MSDTCVVYTAVAGGTAIGDALREPHCPPDPQGRATAFVCFTDWPRVAAAAPAYARQPLHWEHAADPRRTARWHKVNPHLLFADYRYSLWHDGTQRLKVNPWTLIDKYLPRHSGRVLATFKHPDRDCVYQELSVCRRLKKDDGSTMDKQVARYRDGGMPPRGGLFETSVILREHNHPVAITLAAAWWSEIAGGSTRDQLSLPYVVWRLPYLVEQDRRPPARHAVCLMDGCRDLSPYFDYQPHRK